GRWSWWWSCDHPSLLGEAAAGVCLLQSGQRNLFLPDEAVGGQSTVRHQLEDRDGRGGGGPRDRPPALTAATAVGQLQRQETAHVVLPSRSASLDAFHGRVEI